MVTESEETAPSKVSRSQSQKTEPELVNSGRAVESAAGVSNRLRLNTFALISFVWALLAGAGIAAIIFGHVALIQIKRYNEAGKVFAFIGLILGYLSVIVYFGFFVAAIVAGIGGYNWLLSNTPQWGTFFGGGSFLDPMMDPSLTDPNYVDPTLVDPNLVDPNLADPNAIVTE